MERPKLTILRVLKRYDECGFMKPAKNSRSPQNLKDGDIRRLKRESNKICHALLAQLGENMSTSVLQKEIVFEFGINSHIAVEKPFLNDQYKTNRVAFAKEHLKWMIAN